jgi:hypothetical protein
MDPIVRNYQQAIAPNILQNAIASGGLGSSGTEQAFANAQNELARQLGNYSAQVIEPAYQQERQLQQQAIGQAPGLLAPEQQAIEAQRGIAGLQAGAAGQIPGMLSPQEQAIYGTPGLMAGAYTPTQQLLGIGGQQQQQAQDVLNTIFQNQMMPYQMLQQAAGLIGPLSGGGGQSFQVTQAPGGSAK